MTDPTRLKDDPAFGALLRSADADAPSVASRRAVALALGLPVAAALTVTSAATAAAATTATATTATTTTATTTTATATTATATTAGVAGTTVAAKAGLSLVAKIALGLSLATGAGFTVKKLVAPSASPTATVDHDVRPPPAPPSNARKPTELARATLDTAPSGPTNAISASGSATVRQPAARADTAMMRAKATNTTNTTNVVNAADTTATDSTKTGSGGQVLAQEVALVDAAVVALRKGDATTALHSLDEYERRFPSGMLAPEAAVARIEATFASGDAARGKALAASFLAAHPDSPLAQRVRRLLGP